SCVVTYDVFSEYAAVFIPAILRREEARGVEARRDACPGFTLTSPNSATNAMRRYLSDELRHWFCCSITLTHTHTHTHTRTHTHTHTHTHTQCYRKRLYWRLLYSQCLL